MQMMKIFSWNINGLRAIYAKHAWHDFLAEYRPDILGLQEIKICLTQREKNVFEFPGYQAFWNSANRPGYSGTLVLVHNSLKVLHHRNGIGIEKFDHEGRVQTLEFKAFYFINVYFPNSNHELSRLDYKQEFNLAFLKYVKKLEKLKPVIIGGDYNVAHTEIDLAHPKENEGNAGYTITERAFADKFFSSGLIDSFRQLHSQTRKYSWWSYRMGVRSRNIGWRIDYLAISAKLKAKLRAAAIHNEVLGSDHCPISININF